MKKMFKVVAAVALLLGGAMVMGSFVDNSQHLSIKDPGGGR